MSLGHGVSVVKNGLIEIVEPAYATGNATDVVRNKLSQSTITAYNFSKGNVLPVTTLLSNVDPTGAGTSYVTITRNTALETGSITYSVWFNLKGIAINVGANNNWRTFLSANNGTGGSPLSMILEQTLFINFTTTIGGLLRRYVNNNFNPYQVTSDGWQNLVFTYNSTTGIAECYKNSVLVISGPMYTDAGVSNATTAGSQLTYNTYQTNGFKIYGGTQTVANPNGDGMVPGELGVIHIYNRALTAAEILQNFDALRGRYGI